MACKSSTAERSRVPAAALRKDWHGKRDQSDCGPIPHTIILRPIEIPRPIGSAQSKEAVRRSTKPTAESANPGCPIQCFAWAGLHAYSPHRKHRSLR